MAELSMRPIFAAMAASLLVSACTADKAPSEQIGEATEELVENAAQAVTDVQPEGPFAPRNECDAVPGAEAFLASLSRAISERDADALAALTSAHIKLDFGGGRGTDELRSRLAQPERSLWDELADLVVLGCAADADGVLTLPWYFAQDMGDTDPYMAMIVTGNKVPLRSARSTSAGQVEEISWDVVELVDGLHPDDKLQQVRARSGKVGFIDTERLRSVLDYRLIANRIDGQWKITALVAGD